MAVLAQVSVTEEVSVEIIKVDLLTEEQLLLAWLLCSVVIVATNGRLLLLCEACNYLTTRRNASC